MKFFFGLTLISFAQVFSQSHLSLESALNMALTHNYLYQVSDMDAKIAEGMVSWGRADALPKADITASQIHSINDSRQERVGNIVEKKSQAQSTSTQAGILGTWTVFEGLTSIAAHDRLSSQSALASERREQMRQDIAAQVIMAYMDVVRQQRVLSALDSAVALSKERAKITEGKYSFGSVSKLEMLQAKLDLNEDLSSRLKQVAILANVRLVLTRLLTMEDSVSFTVNDTIPLAPFVDYQGLVASARANSPALKQAEQIKNIASAGFREYRGHLFPQLGLSLGYNYTGSESEAGFIKSNQTLGWNYGINVKWNVFDGFVLPNDYHAAKVAERRADLLAQDTKSQLETALAQVRESSRASREVLVLEEANLGLARENVGIAMERLRIGTIASLELRAAQEKYIAAETRLVTARFETKRAETELLRLAGRLVSASP